MIERWKSDPDGSVEQLAELQREHDCSTGLMQRLANRLTTELGRPATVSVVILTIAFWSGANLAAQKLGLQAVEKLPFPDLGIVVAVVALIVALLILTTQEHRNQLAESQLQLTVEIALMSERKVAKIIALLEEARREDPALRSRIDPEAEAMAVAGKHHVAGGDDPDLPTTGNDTGD
ncbi:DUF1003 domain-containing protein [Sphingomonas ginkgonis]|uniref:DUF1003 domain-containing protein n=1 Tax=Sphingomonas ginkgonis TaxID=2315330 RepID=A0A3R9Y6M2_9SPHN|nr:DUF1003 domain-containing protein [Sphingomonas ginkgonis]RST31285.1 DUF1003 domain-containing protein [Sphingomonas ginkgonis]